MTRTNASILIVEDDEGSAVFSAPDWLGGTANDTAYAPFAKMMSRISSATGLVKSSSVQYST